MKLVAINDKGQKRVQDPVKHLGWSIHLLTIYAKGSISDIWQGSKYASEVGNIPLFSLKIPMNNS